MPVKWTLAGPKIIEIVKSLAFQGRKTLESFSRSFWQPVGPQMWVELDWFVLPSARGEGRGGWLHLQLQCGGSGGLCVCSQSRQFCGSEGRSRCPVRVHTQPGFWPDCSAQQQSLVDNKRKVFVDRWTSTGTQLARVCAAGAELTSALENITSTTWKIAFSGF